MIDRFSNDPELVFRVTRFLVWEALLLDEGRLSEWLGLLHPDIHYVVVTRPTLGAGHSANPRHVVAALRLVERATLMWLAVLLVLAIVSVTTGG